MRPHLPDWTDAEDDLTAEGWVRPTEDSIAPDPTSERFDSVAWTLRYGPHPDLYAASVMDAYATLVTHIAGPAMLHRIRKATKKKPLMNDLTAEARRLSTAVDRLEGESLEVIAALGLHEDTPHEKVLAHVRALVAEHAEMRMVMEGHRHRFRSKSNHHPKCDIPMSCQGGCWDLFCGEDLP